MGVARLTWTPERIASLEAMWEAGDTASQIARQLGGTTRSAVIGKAHRLGLKGRVSPIPSQCAGQARKLEPDQRVLFREGGPGSRARVLLITQLLGGRVRGYEWAERFGRWHSKARSVPTRQIIGIVGARTKTQTILARLERMAGARDERIAAAEATHQRQLAALAYPISAAE